MLPRLAIETQRRRKLAGYKRHVRNFLGQASYESLMAELNGKPVVDYALVAERLSTEFDFQLLPQDYTVRFTAD